MLEKIQEIIDISRFLAKTRNIFFGAASQIIVEKPPFQAVFLSLSKNQRNYEAKPVIFAQNGANMNEKSWKPEYFQLRIAIFLRFMAANLSLTHLVTAAKPR